jgi:hypothetical protein
MLLREVPVSAFFAALGLVVCVAGSSGGCAGEVGEAASEKLLEPGIPPTCGDGVCSHDDDEVCENCPSDCGQCPVCGNGKCEAESGLESCESCAQDCGTCSVCGDGSCSEGSGESCTTCASDCGVCAGCGDGTCSDTETCDSCAADCGACSACGDGTCDAAAGETCGSCEDDCGLCETCGDGICSATEDCGSCALDCGSCQRKGCVQGDFKSFHGGLHAHTHVSDGQGSPLEAFKHASQVTKPKLDFLWLSDHHNGITQAEWQGCQAAANKFTTDGVFVAGCGWEKTVFDGSQAIGHFNTLFANTLLKFPSGIPAIYQRLAECAPCVGQFNHPPWPGTFGNYAYYPVAKHKVRLIEFNGRGTFDAKLNAYFTALANGWKVSPSWNEDNHHRGWGDTKRATIVWAAKLTRQSLRQAVLANRTLATDDDTSRMKMLADGACWMGSELHGFGETKIRVELSDQQPGDGFGSVRLFGPQRKLVASKDCNGKNPCSVNFVLNVTKRSHYVVVARQVDGDVIVSAPIWYEP